MTEKSLIFGVLLFLKLQECCFYTQHTLPDIENAHFIEECVRVHNRFRSNVDPPASNMKRMVFSNKALLFSLKCHPRPSAWCYIHIHTDESGTNRQLDHFCKNYKAECKAKTGGIEHSGLYIPRTAVESWDHDLAKTALGWANMCQFKHNPDLKSGTAHPNFTIVGENIWTGTIWYFNVTSALTSWYNEVQHYNYTAEYCKGVCGHYTQMVWAETYKVGCAVHFCPIVKGFVGSNAAHFICNYGPGGNYPRWPYKSGVTCSECYKEPCIDRLCGEVWVKPDSDSYYIVVLVLRTSSFLITFVTVFFLKRHYPRISMYK